MTNAMGGAGEASPDHNDEAVVPDGTPEGTTGGRDGGYGRRALMLGATAAGAAAAVSLVGGGVAEAAPDASGAVQLGKQNKASASTRVTASHGDGLSGFASAKGAAGVQGTDTSSTPGSYGVYGRSAHGLGVLGISDHKTGVTGQAKTPKQAGVSGLDFATAKGGNGVYGQSNLGTGVLGVSFGGTGITGYGKTSGHSGVMGIDGAKSSGHGVYGQSNHGTAVYATSTEGIGVHASSKGGTALEVSGKASFSNSGVAHVPGGQKTVKVTVDGMTAASIVLATIQAPQAGVSIEGAQAGAGSFVITLSGKASGDLPVGWFVIG